MKRGGWTGIDGYYNHIGPGNPLDSYTYLSLLLVAQQHPSYIFSKYTFSFFHYISIISLKIYREILLDRH